MLYLGSRIVDTVVYVPFHTFASNGASVTLTGLAVTDIEIYKDGVTTQRASDSGYTLLDTDGIDFDGITGLHGFKIDLSDNTDASFYEAGSHYMVAVSAVTVDGQTVNFWAASFDIIEAPAAISEVKAVLVEALAADTYAEPGQGTPAATATLAAKVNYLYKDWRNKKTQNSTTFVLYADDGTTADQKATVSDDGTTATKGEMATGA